MFYFIEEIFGDIVFFGDALAESGAVSDYDELDFSAGAAVIEPSGEGNLFLDVVFQVCYFGESISSHIISLSFFWPDEPIVCAGFFFVPSIASAIIVDIVFSYAVEDEIFIRQLVDKTAAVERVSENLIIS